MAESRSAAGGPLRACDRLPPLELPLAAGAGTVAWRGARRRALVVVFVHSVRCEECGAYLDGLAEHASRFQRWDADTVVVLPPGSGGAEAASARAEAHDVDPERWPFQLVVDDVGEAHRRCGIPADRPALFIADRWGQIYEAVTAESEAGLPTPEAIDEWLKYLATQCAECGVPDDPGYGEWAP